MEGEEGRGGAGRGKEASKSGMGKERTAQGPGSNGQGGSSAEDGSEREAGLPDVSATFSAPSRTYLLIFSPTCTQLLNHTKALLGPNAGWR